MLVLLSGPGGEVPTYALLDDSDVEFTTTLIDTELADALGLVGSEQDIFMGVRHETVTCIVSADLKCDCGFPTNQKLLNNCRRI